MLYSILRFFIKALLGFYFRRIHISGLEHLSSDKPTILACTHPSSFMEAILLASYLPRDLHFIVRGDVFKTKLLRWFLKHTHQIPIFRLRDGMANLRNNNSSFEYCYSALRKNAAIIIFSESTTKFVKHLRPLHRGTWRLAYNALEDNPTLDLQIVPIGINYVDVDRFRSEVMVSVGESINVSTFINQSIDNKRGTIIKGTEELAISMKEQVIHFEDEMSELLGNPYLLQIRSPYANQKIVYSDEQFNMQKQFATYFSSLPIEEKNDTSLDLAYHINNIKNQGQTQYKLASNKPSLSFIRTIILIIPSSLGFLINFLPFTLASKMRKGLVKQVEFYAPVRIGLWLIFMGIQLIVLFAVGFVFYGWYAIMVFAMPFFIRFYIEMVDQS